MREAAAAMRDIEAHGHPGVGLTPENARGLLESGAQDAQSFARSTDAVSRPARHATRQIATLFDGGRPFW